MLILDTKAPARDIENGNQSERLSLTSGISKESV